MNKEEKIKKIEEEISKARNNLTTDRLDMSFGEIISMYEREEIIINPEFQRLFRWKDDQKTKFIESILLGIPIPPIFVAEDSEGRWELVDGLQRLSTVLSFFGLLKSEEKKITAKNNWVLQEGSIIGSFSSFKCADLPLKYQLNIKRFACRVEVAKWDSQYDMRFELFNRLNTGGSPLTPQEIRNCIFRGVTTKFNDYLKENAGLESFTQLITPTETQIEQLYLEELVLRFTSLIFEWENVQENISEHMTEFMRNAVKNPKFDYGKYQTIFRDVINILSPLGKDLFRIKGNFSVRLYDAITVGIGENIDYYKSLKVEDIKEKIDELKNNTEFQKYAGAAVDSKNRVFKRLEASTKIFKPKK